MSNKHSKRYLLILPILIVAFFINTTITKADGLTFINYYGIEIDSEEYSTLLNLGFSDYEIYYMDETTFEENKDLDATLIATNTKYYKTETPAYGNGYTTEISEEEYNSVSDVALRTIVETTYKKMVATISANGNKYRYKVSLTWKILPSCRSYDIIGIGFSDPVYISSSVYFNFVYTNTNGSTTTSTQYYDRKSTSTGGAAVYKLPTNITALSANLYYDVSKNTNNTLTSISMCGDYSHATSSVPVSLVGNYSIGLNGISLGASIGGYYDALPCALTTASVSW